MAVWCLVAIAGCAQRTDQPTEDPVPTAGPQAAATAPAAENAAEAPSVARAADVDTSTESAVDDRPAAPGPEPMLPSALPESEPAQSVAPSGITLEAFDPAALAPEAAAVAESDSAPGIHSPAASPIAAATLDFSSLVTRLRKTKAINLRTKVAVKNESDDLLEQFRAYHAQPGIVTLADLRRSYDSLFHKLHSLLEHADPPLARDIDRSQAAIWELLADPSRFTASVMAGA
jgi:hypothetical protein